MQEGADHYRPQFFKKIGDMKSTAAQVRDLLWQGPGTLQSWESMKILIIDWMETEVASLRKYRARLEQEDDPKSAAKAYQLQLRLQNFQAAQEVLDAMYQHLFSMHERSQGLLADLKRRDRRCVQLEHTLHHFHSESMHMHEYSAFITNRLMAFADRGENPERLKHLIKTSDTFREGIEMLIAHDITTL